MKSRVLRRGTFETKIEWSGKQTLRLASTLALATALSFIVQPLTSQAFAKTGIAKENSKIALRFKLSKESSASSQLAESKPDSEEADEDAPKGEPAKSKKEAEKAKKESEKAEKKAKEAAKEAAADKDDKKAKAKKDEKVEKEAKKTDGKKVDKEAKKADDKKVEKEAKKSDDKNADKDAKAKAAEEEDKKAAKKKKKGSWFGRGEEEVVEIEEVVEVAAPDSKKAADVKPAAGAKPAAVVPAAKAAPGVEAAEKPLLLPDKALVSVLQDISKSLGDVTEETGVETPDEKVIVGLARQILDKALGAGEFKDNRILAKENSSTAKNSMTTEAWASGDITISEKLRGSVATVWGKRINGMLHVTVAGECQDKTLSNGEKVGEFIVVIKGRSPVKSGFDIQSQADVTYWIGALNSVAVENACCRLKEKSPEAEGDGEATPPAKSDETKGEVKKKSTVVLETILTKRGMEYLKALAKYQEQQQSLIAQQHADAALADTEEGTTDNTEARASGDEVEVAKGARKSKSDDEDTDGERVAKRPRANDDGDDEPVARRPRSTDDEVDGERVVRRPRSTNDDEVDGERVVRRPRSTNDDEVDGERVARRPRSNDDDFSPGRVAPRNRSADDEIDGERAVRRPKSNDDDVDVERSARRPRTSDPDADDVDVDWVPRRPRSNDESTDGARRPRSSNVTDAERTTRRPRSNEDDDFSPGKVPQRLRSSDDTDADRTARRPGSNDNDDFNPGKVVQRPRSSADAEVSKNQRSSTDAEASKNPRPSDEARTAKSEPSWRDDWSRDGGGESVTLTTNQASKLPVVADKVSGSQIVTPTNNEVSLTRISMTPAPASASSRAWESPAVNAAPHAPSLGATLLIPERAIAGQFLTVSVIAKDKQPERSVELSFNGATLSTDLQGQVMYMIPDDMPPGQSLNIALTDRPELNARVVDILQPLDDASGQKSPRIDKVSQLVASEGILVIDGHDFDGLAERNRIVIDNEHPSKVIAASPVQLRALVPAKLTPGTHTVTINSSDLRSTPAKFDFVKAEIEQQDLRKTKGVVSRIVVRVQGTKQPVAVRVVNRTPDVIKMSKGDNLLITTSGGADNSYIVGVKQLKKGDYKVEASIEI